MSSSHISFVFDAIRACDDAPLLIDRRAEGLSGISGLKTVGLLQRLAQRFETDPTAAYLEIGVFQGLTLVSSALAAPGMPCFGVDNFRILDPKKENFGLVEDRIARFGTANAQLLNMDFEDAFDALDATLHGRRIAVYLIDGPHDYRSQLVCLLRIKPFLHENAVIVVDDANYPDVRWATRDFLQSHPDFKLVFDAYSPDHPANLSDAEKTEHEAGWLNGVHVITHDPDRTLAPMLPPTDAASRILFFNEWLAHRLRYAELAPEALMLAEAVLAEDDAARAQGEIALRHAAQDADVDFAGRRVDRNVYSRTLSSGRFADRAS
jgi:hypothetical protein